MNILDRTLEPRPLLITTDTDMSAIVLVDNNQTRPAVIVKSGASFSLGAGYRSPSAGWSDPIHPGLGQTFDGTFLPKLQVDFSKDDFAESFVVIVGSGHLFANQINSPGCVMLVSGEDGTLGYKSTVLVGVLAGCRMGVLAAGQGNLSCDIKHVTLNLYPTGPAGHAFYANELRDLTGAAVHMIDSTIRIGSVDAIATSPGIRLDNVSAKFKGSWNVDYACIEDRNPCGCLDAFDSSGTARVDWVHPGGDAMNGVFAAFRNGTANFGPAPGNWVVTGRVDAANVPDKTVPCFRWESKTGVFGTLVADGAGSPSIWPGASAQGQVWTKTVTTT